MAKVRYWKLQCAIGLMAICLIAGGSIGLLGHLLAWYLLYTWTSTYVGMAVPTAVLFIVAGAALLGINLLASNWRDDHEGD